MHFVYSFVVLVLAYLVGSIPDGLLVAKWMSGKDVRTIESGRTGGTNVMRTAGYPAGIITVILDVVKGIAATWITLAFFPQGNPWLQVAAALLAIIGHNYSLFLIERDENGKLRFRGGAGGSTCLGGTIGIYPVACLYILPIALICFFIVGYASVTTFSLAVSATILFIYLAVTGVMPWAYVAYGVGSMILLGWALRPNFIRLLNGNERLVGLRASLKKKKLNSSQPTEQK